MFKYPRVRKRYACQLYNPIYVISFTFIIKSMTIYKYLNPERIDVLQNLNIRITQPVYLNDPYENNLDMTKFEISDEDWKVVSEIECRRNGIDPASVEKLQNKEERKALMPETVLLMRSLLTYTTGVLSLTETFDNALMWAHYCQNHQGYVIGFDSNHEFFSNSGKRYSINNLSPVRYSKNRPVFKISTSMEELFFVKSDHWSYEREWRLLKNVADADKELADREICLFKIPKEAVTSIYIGASCSVELEGKIIESLNNFGLDVEVRKIVLNPENFALDSISYDEWLKLQEQITQGGVLQMLNDFKQLIRTKNDTSA